MKLLPWISNGSLRFLGHPTSKNPSGNLPFDFPTTIEDPLWPLGSHRGRGGEGRSGRQPENIDLPLEGPLFALRVSVCGMGLIVAITDYTHKLEIRYRCAMYPRIIVEHNTCRWRFTRIFLRRTHQLFSFSGKSAAEPTQQR